MKPTFADFSVTPPRLSNAVVTYRACHSGAHHHALGAGGSVRIGFKVKKREEIAEATLKVTALVSKLGSSMGFAPMSVLVNGEAVADRLTVPGGGDLPQDNVFAVPGQLLKPGANTLEIRSSDDARSMLWLYRITLDSVYQRDRSERALGAEADKLSVFAFRTERRTPGAGSWAPAPDLLFHLDRGERAVPAQLSWRGTDGAEAAVSFAANMSGFHGYHRTSDGMPSEFRGSLTGRWAFPEGTAKARVRRFLPEESWGGGGWHTSGELRFLLEDGGAPVERITWRDQRENSGSIVLRSVAPHDISDLVTGVRASDEYAHAGEFAGNLLDSARTKWLAGARSATVDFALARPVAVTSYTLTTANDFPGRDPRDWTLQGSHDGVSWTVLDSRAQESFSGRFQTRDFSLANATAAAFAHYRLAVTHNRGAGEVQLAQVRLFAGGTSTAPSPYDFLGYYQRVNEGPIGYRGTAVHSAPEPEDHRAPTDPLTALPPQDAAPRPAAPAPETLGPDDLLITSRDLDSKQPWLKTDEQVPRGRVLHTAALLRWSPAAVVERLTALGHADFQNAEAPLPDSVDPDDAPLVSKPGMLGYNKPWLDINAPVTLRHVLEAACETHRSPADVARRLTALGYRLGGEGDRPLPESPDPSDVMLILSSRGNYQDCLDWGDEVPEYHVFRAADLVTRRPHAVATRLIALGFRLPVDILDRTAEPVRLRPDMPDDVPEADDDLVILSEELDGHAPWLAKNTVVGLQVRHILRAALATGRSPADIAGRLAALGHRLHDDAHLPAVADEADISLLETVDRSYLDNVRLGHVLRSASLTGRSPADVASRLTALGYRLPDDVEYPGVRGTLVTG